MSKVNKVNKNRYHGTLSWSDESHEMWCFAINEEKALDLMIVRLAKKLQVNRWSVAQRFLSGVKDNYYIERR